MGMFWDVTKAWAHNKMHTTKTRMYGRGKKCSFCRRDFGPHDVSKSVMTKGGGAREACGTCASAMGHKNPVNIIANPPKKTKAKSKKK